MRFLRFIDEAAARDAFANYMTDDHQWPSYIKNVAVDVIGKIQKLHDDHEVTTLPGYHINLSGPLSDFEDFEIPTPATPARVFAGVAGD